MPEFRSLSSRVALPLTMLVAFAWGCADESNPMTRGDWRLRGLPEGEATLTELRSGRSWKLPPDPIVGDGWSMSYNGTFATGDLEFPRVGNDWEFALEYESADTTICDLEGDVSGVYDDTVEWEQTVFVQVTCGLPFADVEVADPALAACIAAVDDPPEHVGHLYELDCADRGIESIEGIGQYWALRHLDLTGNELTTYEAGGDDRLGNLDWIGLSHNQIETVDLSGGSWAGINLSFNRITEIRDLRDLHAPFLTLRHNELETFEIAPVDPLDEFGPGVSINYLDLGHNQLESLDFSEIAHYFESLDVSYNQLETLNLRSPEGDEYLIYKTFEKLDASFNRLVDESAGSPPTGLVMPAGGISVIDLTANALTALTPAIASGHTGELSIGQNKISTLDFSSSGGFAWLDLSGNALESMDLSSGPLIRELDLSGNEVTSFAWPGANSITETIDLSRNPLSSLSTCAAPWLFRLRAEDAEITEIDISGCPSLEHVELAGNALTTLDPSGNVELEFVDLRENPVTCPAVTDFAAQAPDVELLYDEGVCGP